MVAAMPTAGSVQLARQNVVQLRRYLAVHGDPVRCTAARRALEQCEAFARQSEACEAQR